MWLSISPFPQEASYRPYRMSHTANKTTAVDNIAFANGRKDRTSFSTSPKPNRITIAQAVRANTCPRCLLPKVAATDQAMDGAMIPYVTCSVPGPKNSCQYAQMERTNVNLERDASHVAHFLLRLRARGPVWLMTRQRLQQRPLNMPV